MTPSSDAGPSGAASRLPGRLAVVFAGVMHLAVGGFVLASTRVLPLVLATVLVGLWVAVAVLGWRWRHARPVGVLLLPFVVAGAWWLAALATRAD